MRVLWAPAWPKMLPGGENLTLDTDRQLGTDLAQSRTLDVQVGRTLYNAAPL